MNLPRSAAVIGLGLMGGSLARDLAALGVEVWAHDRDPGATRDAREQGVIRAELPPSLEGAEEADLLVLATPVSAAPSVLQRLAPRLGPESVVTDLGSTKRSLAAAAQRFGLAERFVGGHPLAGDHRSGWEASRTGLFRDARVFLCPTPTTSASALERVRQVWLRLGGRPEVLAADEHDRRLAWTSHLPQVAASALAAALAAGGVPRATLGPGGRDTTRLAASSPEMWSAISLDNAEFLGESVEAVIERLAAFRHALRSGDAAGVERLFASARSWSLEEPQGS